MKCFEYNKEHTTNCKKDTCRYWMQNKKYQNCCIIASQNDALDTNENKFTLQDIGDIFKVTRMRICQIEKIAIKKLKDRFANFE